MPWANAIESFFATLIRRRLQRGVFRSLVDLQAAINRFLNAAHHDDAAHAIRERGSGGQGTKDIDDYDGLSRPACISSRLSTDTSIVSARLGRTATDAEAQQTATGNKQDALRWQAGDVCIKIVGTDEDNDGRRSQRVGVGGY